MLALECEFAQRGHAFGRQLGHDRRGLSRPDVSQNHLDVAVGHVLEDLGGLLRSIAVNTFDDRRSDAVSAFCVANPWASPTLLRTEAVFDGAPFFVTLVALAATGAALDFGVGVAAFDSAAATGLCVAADSGLALVAGTAAGVAGADFASAVGLAALAVESGVGVLVLSAAFTTAVSVGADSAAVESAGVAAGGFVIMTFAPVEAAVDATNATMNATTGFMRRRLLNQSCSVVAPREARERELIHLSQLLRAVFGAPVREMTIAQAAQHASCLQRGRQVGSRLRHGLLGRLDACLRIDDVVVELLDHVPDGFELTDRRFARVRGPHRLRAGLSNASRAPAARAVLRRRRSRPRQASRRPASPVARAAPALAGVGT